jgi:hypothetical protein
MGVNPAWLRNAAARGAPRSVGCRSSSAATREGKASFGIAFCRPRS